MWLLRETLHVRLFEIHDFFKRYDLNNRICVANETASSGHFYKPGPFSLVVFSAIQVNQYPQNFLLQNVSSAIDVVLR